MKGGESCLDRVATGLLSNPGSAVPRTEKPRWSAGRRAPFSHKGAPCSQERGSHDKAPTGAPLPLVFRGAKSGYGAPAPQTTGPAEPWLFEK
jgi:hypothetical protein